MTLIIISFFQIQILLEYSEKNRETNENGLFEMWPACRIKLIECFNENRGSHNYVSQWPDDIEEMLIFLKLFPSKQIGRNVLATADNFFKSSAKLITFELVSVFLMTMFLLTILKIVISLFSTVPSCFS